MAFRIARADGSALSSSGYKRGGIRQGSRRYNAERYEVEELPRRVDLRPHMTPIENQEDTMSCTANAVAGAYEYLVKQHTGEDYDVSRMFIYYNARALGEGFNPRDDEGEVSDDGSSTPDAIEGLRQFGACSEETWPFDENAVNDRPEDHAYEEAQHFVVEETAYLPLNLHEWKHALAEGRPIIFGLALYDSFDRQRRPGEVPVPSNREAAREAHGLHAMLAVGYSDRDRVFIVRNSWGETWGDGGYCYIPYDYMLNPAHNNDSAWVIHQLQNPDVTSVGWSNEEGSILEELHTALSNMSDEDYTALLDAMGDVPLEARLAHLFLCAVGADGHISEEELNGVAEYLHPVLQVMRSSYSAARLLRNAEQWLENEELLQETVQLFGEHLPREVLASMAQALRSVAESDELDENEEAFIDQVLETWQLGDEF